MVEPRCTAHLQQQCASVKRGGLQEFTVTLSALLQCSFSERELEFFLNVDFVDHVALMAWAEEPTGSVIVGGGRYVVVQPSMAEVALIVIDRYQGQGAGAALMRHLAVAHAAGLKQLIAQVFSKNAPMLKVLKKSGLHMTTMREVDVVQVALQVIEGTCVCRRRAARAEDRSDDEPGARLCGRVPLLRR